MSFEERDPLAPPLRGGLPRGPGATALALAALVAVLYGRHLGEGLLADDFLYARWARQGWGVLLRHVTVASSPQMIRPLPGLLWELTRSSAGPAVLHLLSLLLHGGNGVLIATFLRRRGIREGAAFAFAALFVAFPLSTEPVIWASASFDLWACGFALAAGVVAVGAAEGEEPGWGRALGAAGLFLLALLSKESVLPLPFLLPLLVGWRPARRYWRPAVAMALVAAVYFLGRLALFHGPGGYLGDNGSSLLFSLKALPTLRSVFLRTPLRLLVPVKRPGALAPGFAVLSALLLGGALIPWFRARPGRLLLAAVAVGIALLPVLPILSIGVDQEGSRLLYFPAAVALLAVAASGRGGPVLPRAPRASRWAVAGLLLYWSAATLWNGGAWTAAAAEVGRTRAVLAALAPRFPPGSQVVVAGYDSWEGAFAWRNGLAAAAEVDELPGHHLWTWGTAAAVEVPGPWLGQSLFEVGPGGSGGITGIGGIGGIGRRGTWGDRTACARAVLATSGPAFPSLAAWPVAAGPDPGGDPITEVVLPAAPLPSPAPPAAPGSPGSSGGLGGDLVVWLQLGTCRPRAPISGTLFWLFADSRKFEATDSLPFVVGPRSPAEIGIHLLPSLSKARRERITLLLDLPREIAPCVRGARVVAAPPICRQ